MSQTCPKGHLNSDGSAFCNSCGSQIEVDGVERDATVRDRASREAQSPAPPESTPSLWVRPPTWAKVVAPIGGTVAVIGLVIIVANGVRGPHVPTEADYRHAFEDIATVVNANGGNWETPAAYPSPLSSWSEEKLSDVKTVLVDPACTDLSEGVDSMERKLDLALAFAKDSGDSVEFALVTNQAVIEAAVKYVCPQHADVARSASGYINALLVLGW